MTERGVVVLKDEPAPTGGRRVVYLLPDNRRIPVVLPSTAYSPEAVELIGQALDGGQRRAPKGSRTGIGGRANG